MNFNDDLHDDLFKLFILASNEFYVNWVFSEEYMHHIINNRYFVQYSDRTIHEERVEHEGWVSDYGMLAIQTTGCGFEIQQRDDSYYFKNKIKFYFVDENKQGE